MSAETGDGSGNSNRQGFGLAVTQGGAMQALGNSVALGSGKQTAWQIGPGSIDMSRGCEASRRLSFLAGTAEVTVDRARTAVIVVDMQNDFCTPGGWLEHIGVDISGARGPIAPLQALLPALRAGGVTVAWVNWGNRPDRLNLSPALLHVYNPDGRSVGLGDPLPSNGSPVLQAGSWAAAIVDELVPEPGDVRVDKYRMSGFWDTPLDSILRNLDIRTVLFAGVNADQCVLATLMDANFLGYDTFLIEDCTATTSPAFCMEATLYNVRQCFGFVTDSAAILEGVPA